MGLIFENFYIVKNDALVDRPFVVACKDREVTDGERLVIASLSNEEAKQVYEYLGKCL